MAKSRGLLVTLEGMDGSGKSTQTRLLARALKRAGHRVTVSREPGGCARSARIRALLLDRRMEGLDAAAELLLFAADRRQHVVDVLNPALERGELVLCDRFTDSTLAYQGARGRVAPADLLWIARFAASGRVPDLTLLFDLPVAEGLERARRARGGPDRMERADTPFFNRVRRGYLALAKREPERIKVIAASRRGPREILDEALGLVERRMGRR